MSSKISRKFIAIITIGLFLSLVGHTSTDRQAGGTDKKTNPESTFTGEIPDTGGGLIEQEGTESRKKKKFPWLLVIGGTVVVGVALYLLLKKSSPDEYKLTVTLSNGVTGTPAAGAHTHEDGTVVNYSYALASGYKDLKVTLDGQAAAATGTVTMNRDHALSVSAIQEEGTTPEPQNATVHINSTPSGAAIIMDGQNTGHTTNHTYTFSTAGSHDIILQKAGYLEYSGKVSAVLGSTNTLNATLQGGLDEPFNSGAMSSPFWLWQPNPNGSWSVAGGEYFSKSSRPGWDYSIYGHPFTRNQYTVTVKMKHSRGMKFSPVGIFLATSASTISVDGYVFNYNAYGWASVWKMQRINYKNIMAGWIAPIYKWRQHPAVDKGLHAWNVLKVVRDGSNYTFYINNKLITSFSDTAHDPSHLVIMGASAIGQINERAVQFFTRSLQMTLNFDYVKLVVGLTAGSVPGSPVASPMTRIGEYKDGSPMFYKDRE